MLTILGLFFSLCVGYISGRKRLYYANLGEALVASVIANEFKRPHLLINNVTLKLSTGTTQIDHILVADTGIYVIETKHYRGWIFGDPNNPQWTQVFYQQKRRFQNPIRQNLGHIKTLEVLLNIPSESFISVIVFTGEAEFKTDLGPTVFKLRDLVRHLSQDRPVLYSETQMASIIGLIEMKRERRSLENDEYHINSIRSRIGQKSPFHNTPVN